ncbi:hypothetical protein E2I00_008893, partial [Balaenoptera physalus]
NCPIQIMDPEVSLLLQCPPGGLPEEQVRAELSAAYDRRPLPGGDKAITAVWESRLQAQPWLFDAPKFRLHSATLVPTGSPGPQLHLASECGEKQGGKRGAGAEPDLLQALCPGDRPLHINLPGELVVHELFSSVLQEICDEVNLPLLTLSQPLLLGIACNETSAGRASAEFYVQCSLTSEQVRKHYMNGGPEAHESTGIIFVETQVCGGKVCLQWTRSWVGACRGLVMQSVRRLQETEMWAELCPSAKGAIFLYNKVQESSGEVPGRLWGGNCFVKRVSLQSGVTANCPPAFMLPLRLRRLWPHSPPTRFFAAAARQRSGPSNYYELLGVHPGASAEEVKRAFFSKSKELHPDRDPRNPALHSRFVELSEAYQVLSHEQSRRSYDHQLRSAASPKCPGTTAHPRSAHQAHRYSSPAPSLPPPSLLGSPIFTLSLLLPPSSSWAPPNAKYWAQFHEVRPQGPESRQQQHKHNRRVLGYCLLVMLAGMGLHYVAFRKLEQMHRSFMDEKDRIITAIYNDTRARA